MDNICDTYYTVIHWKQEDADSQKRIEWITKRIGECLRNANADANLNEKSKLDNSSKHYDNLELTWFYREKMEDAVAQGKFSDDEDLLRAIDATVLCEEVVHKAGQYKHR